MRFNWQNLNEDREGNVKGWPYHGRSWLNIGDRTTIRFEWHLWRRSAAAEISLDGSESEAKLHMALLPVSLWFAISTPALRQVAEKLIRPKSYGERAIGIRFFDWTLWWQVWMPDNESSSTDPRWRRGSFDVRRFLLGNEVVTRRVLEGRAIVVPMPERSYRGKAALLEITRKRPRWFAEHYRAVDTKMDDGEQVPIPGKGENGWDCGNDATFASYTPADSIEEAIGKFVTSTLRTRQRRGGDWNPPPPERQPPVSPETITAAETA